MSYGEEMEREIERMKFALNEIHEETEKMYPVLFKFKDSVENLSQAQSMIFYEITKHLEAIISISRREK